MFDELIAMPLWLGALLTMLLTTGTGLLVWVLAYRFISRHKSSDVADPVASLFRVIGILVSLMLSIAFTEVIVSLRAVEKAIEREVVAITDTFSGLRRFDEAATRSVRGALIEYIRAVADDEWAALGDDHLGERTSALMEDFIDEVMRLEATTPTQERILSLLMADVDAITDNRLIRLDGALAKPPVYIRVVFFGFLITMACFGVYRPQVPLVVLVCMYTVFVGLVLYLIVALSDPFNGSVGLDSDHFERLAVSLEAELEAELDGRR
jgi:hypothetical protein